MMRHSIPYCYFPTKILLVDDNANYLNNVVLTFDKKINHAVHTHPKKLVETLLANPESSLTKKYLLNHDDAEAEDNTLRHPLVSVDIERIYQEVNNSQRFDRISILLVDYAMPEMNGVEFFQALQDLPVKKVMVTGEADYGIAVNAFNEGIIDRFIGKDDPNFFATLNKTILELQKIYFQELSAPIINNLQTDINCCLGDPVFQQFFQKLLLEKKIVEYYLLDATGSFLLLDYCGKPIWLIIKNEKELADYADIASENKEISELLMQRKKIPFFLTETDWQIPVDAWLPYLHSAQKLNNYYFAIVEGDSIYGEVLNDVVSYKQYRKLK